MSPDRRIRFLILIAFLALMAVMFAAITLFKFPLVNQEALLILVSLSVALVSGLLLVWIGRPLFNEVHDIQERFKKYYDVGLVGIADTSLETGWLRFNDRLCDMLGYTREELKNTNWVELTHPADLEDELKEFRRALSGESNGYTREKRFIRKNGAIFHAIIALRCVWGSDGKVDYFITFLFDIGPRKEAEEALRKSQKGLARAQELAHLGSWDWDIAANQISWSDETYRIFSMKPQEFEATYEAVLQSVHPDDRRIERAAMGRALLNPKQKYSVEYRVLRPDDTVRFVHLLGEIIRDESNEPTKMEGFIQDITDYKRIESQLRDLNAELEQRVNERTHDLMKANSALRSEIAERIEVEGMLRTLFDNSPDHILSVDREGVVQFYNSHPKDQFPPMSKGKKLCEVMPANLFEQCQKRLNQVFTGNKTTSLQMAWENDSWWEVRMAPIHRANETHAVMMVFTDITEKRILQIQAIHNARLASLGVLAASVAHEINNPNNAIGFSCSSLGNFWAETVPVLEHYRQQEGEFELGGMPLDEALNTVPRLISGVGKNVNRVKTIVEKLKHMGRQDVDELEEELNLLDLLQSAVSILNSQIRKHTDRFKLTCGSEPIIVRGNGQQLEQVFINLVQNGLQSLSGRDKRLDITVHVDPTVDQVFVDICDQGEGIPQQLLDRITTPFFTTKGKAGGMGLGLSITDTIVKNHKGQLTFESHPSTGTTARVQLPLCGKVGNEVAS